MNSNKLKIIAAISMLIDHIGIMFYPNITLFRILGRLSFPIFAFMISEGCFYTKNRLRYFLNIFILGFILQIIYYLYDKSLDMSILITFSLSIIMIYALDYFMKKKNILSGLMFISSIIFVYILNIYFNIDYGFVGSLVPLFSSVCRKKYISILLFFIPNFILFFTMENYQVYSIFSILLLLLYNGKRGKYNLKYFFYIFYPLHLGLLELIRIIISK